MLYYLINIATGTIVGEFTSYEAAEICLMDEVRARDGYYTLDDFSILDENEIGDYVG